MTEFVIVRHAQSTGNAGGVFVGQGDAHLSPLGTKQAEATGEYLKDEHIDAFYSSDLSRAYDTARIIAGRHGAVPIADVKLREINAGLWQGRDFEYLKNTFKNYTVWLNDIGNAVCDGGESVSDLQRRINGRLCELAECHDGEKLCIVTHATPIRTMCCIWNGTGLDGAKNIPWVTNCSVTRASLSDGVWTVKTVGYDGHLKGLSSGFPPNV